MRANLVFVLMTSERATNPAGGGLFGGANGAKKYARPLNEAFGNAAAKKSENTKAFESEFEGSGGNCLQY